MKPQVRTAGLVIMAGSLALMASRTACYVPFKRPPLETATRTARSAAGLTPTRTSPEPTRLRGVLHVHLPSTVAAFEATLRAAGRSGLDFILFSSPGTLDPATDGRQGYYMLAGVQAAPVHAGEKAPAHPLLVLMGVELRTDRGPLLIAGGSRETYPLTHRAERLIQAAHANGALVVALRPCRLSPATGEIQAPGIPDPPDGVDAMEAVSTAADFSSLYYPDLLQASLISLLNPPAALASLAQQPAGSRPPAASLAWRGPARPVGGYGLTPGEGTWPDHADPSWSLDWVTTTVSLDQPLTYQPARFAHDGRRLIQALIHAQTETVVHAWGDPPALRLRHQAGRNSLEASISGGPPVWMVLRRNGQVAAAGPGPHLQVAPAVDGVWRVESYLRRRDAGLPGDGWLLWQVEGPLQISSGETPPQ